jgi:two-component system phosphate regulon sensor histidine kinase PhoR
LSLFAATRRQLATYAAAAAEGERQRNLLTRERDAVTSQRDGLMDILDGLGEGLLAVDSRHRIVLANPRFGEMFSLDAGVVVGRPLADVVRLVSVFDTLDAALAGREATARFNARFGVAERHFEVRAFPLPSGEIAAVALFFDVTHVERLEQIRRNFISDFSHEVRTPLTGLRTAVESFVDGGEHMTAEEDRQLRRIMTRQLARLQRLVDDLAELSGIESGDIGMERQAVELESLVRDLCEDFEDRAAQNGFRFVLDSEPLRVCGDPMRLQQAFSNLIDNAIKYGGDGGTIELDVFADGNWAAVSITDHGHGIAEEDRERIFRRFYRVDKGRSQAGGSGLGLAITKHLVLLHRGSIDVTSVAGEGSTFIVRLPRSA